MNELQQKKVYMKNLKITLFIKKESGIAGCIRVS